MVEEKDNLDTLTEEKWNSLGVLQDFEFDDPTWKVKLKGPNDTMLGMVYFDDGWFFEDSMGRRISMEELGWGDSVVVCNEEGEAEENDLLVQIHSSLIGDLIVRIGCFQGAVSITNAYFRDPVWFCVEGASDFSYVPEEHEEGSLATGVLRMTQCLARSVVRGDPIDE